MATALIGPTGYGTFGVLYREFPQMEARGGYSGPFKTGGEAERGAQRWADYYEVELDFEYVPNVNAEELHAS